MKRFRLLIGCCMLIAVLVSAAPIAADGPTPGRAGRDEVRFLEGMSDHHQMALDMANDCLKKAKTDALLTLCKNIITAQSAEIKTMQGWLSAWYKIDYQTVSMMGNMKDNQPGMAGMQMGTAEPTASTGAATDPAGMMGMMAGFNRLEGREYELAWLESMIDHHDDAIHMSQRILKSAQHKELRDMAQKIIGDQGGEIRMMEALLVQFGDQ